MLKLSVDQVRALAPGPAALQAGQGLADARHWTGLGCSEAAVWGECRGSGKEPYKVRVDLSNNGSACTCPSRKFPCKHVLGLLLLGAGSPSKLVASKPPTWVSEWLQKRAARPTHPIKEPAKDVSNAAKQKEASRRAARREQLVESGLEALELWLQDLARQGLAFAQTVPASFWEAQAARLVDSQLPGAARLVREMAALPGQSPDWAALLLLRLGRLHLLVKAYRRLESLPEDSRQDVRALLGWSVNQADLQAAQAGLSDDWLVLASLVELDERTNLRTQITWLWGRVSGRPAQVINHAFGGQPLDASLAPGLVLRGELVYFPGAWPLRALFKDRQVVDAQFVPGGYPDLAVFLESYAVALGANPWLEMFPVVLEKVLPQPEGNNWLLRDIRNQALPLSARFTAYWELFSISGGLPLTVFGAWDGFTFLPLASWSKDRYVRLQSNADS
jgi:hypothetical protein